MIEGRTIFLKSLSCMDLSFNVLPLQGSRVSSVKQFKNSLNLICLRNIVREYDPASLYWDSHCLSTNRTGTANR